MLGGFTIHQSPLSHGKVYEECSIRPRWFVPTEKLGVTETIS
jgi:hypothetical protein